jgi:LPS-assembly protein
LGRLAIGLTLVLGGTATWGAEVRVLSGPGAATTVTIGAVPGVEIEDRTPGAKPVAQPSGPASTGETFTGELTLLLRGFMVPRPAAIEVADPVVSAVRLFPEAGATTATVFVRQPVTYSVSRPSPSGEVRVELRSKTRPLTVTGVTPRGRPRVVAPKPTGEREVAVDAESLSYDQATNTLTARGGVTLTRGDTTLTADEVVYDRTNEIAEARGHVVLSDPQATVEGDFAHLDLDDETGWIEDANASLHVTNYILRARRLDKKGGPRYSVANGVFTTCECGGLEKPSWSIAGAHTDVTLQGRGVVRSMTFRVKDVPVLWVPYLLFPANTQRQSGFLIPRVGFSNRRGFQYEQPFFWAISKSTDATVALDVETEARLGMTAEYRYVLSRATRGAFTVGYYNEAIRGRSLGTREPGNLPADIPENRFAIAGHHVQPFYGKSKFYLDMLALSDDLFLREINTFAFSTRNDLALRSTRFTTSRAGLYKGWGEGLANLEAAYYQDLIDPQELALQKMPRLDAEHSLPLLGDRLVARFAGQAIDYQREEGFSGVRADLAPDLLLPFHLGRMLNGSLTGRVRETAYHLTDREQVAFAVPDPGVPFRGGFVRAPEPRLPSLKADHTRELGEVQGRLGTALERVFTFRHLGFEKLKHTLEPEMQYLFVPPLHRQFDRNRTTIDCGELPGGTPGTRCPVTLFGTGYLFDERDAINRRNFFSYGLTSRLLARGPTPAEASGREAAETGAVEPGVDPDAVPQGLPADALPGFVGPPTPPAPAGKSAPGAKPPPAPRELARASILHGYDVSRTLVDDSHKSDIDLGLRLTPLDYLAMAYNTTVSAEQSAVRGMSVGVVLREPWWKPSGVVGQFQSASTVGLSYRFIESSVNQDLATGRPESLLLRTEGVDEIDGSLYLRLGSYLGFTFLSRYSFNDAPVVDQDGRVVTNPNGSAKLTGGHFLERDYLVRLISRCNCWMIEAGLADKFNPDERLFRVQLTLVGLGSFGRSPLNRNYVGFAPLAQLGLRRPGTGPSAGGLF